MRRLLVMLMLNGVFPDLDSGTGRVEGLCSSGGQHLPRSPGVGLARGIRTRGTPKPTPREVLRPRRRTCNGTARHSRVLLELLVGLPREGMVSSTIVAWGEHLVFAMRSAVSAVRWR
jgi:hypothetical protein